MRRSIGGDGSDTTAKVSAWLAAGGQLRLANLYLLGEPEDPMALWFTDWESPLCWPVWTSQKVAAGAANAFDPAVVHRGREYTARRV